MPFRTVLAVAILSPMLVSSVSAKDRSLEEFTAYASRRIANADAETIEKFVAAVDRNGDGLINDDEFAGRIAAYQKVFQTVFTKAPAAGHSLPENWKTDFEEATKQAAKSGKPLLVMFSASWCAPCKMMIAQVYPNQKVKKALEAFIPVYIDSEVHQDLAAQHAIRAYPTFVCITPQGEAIANRVGGGNVEAFVELIDTFKVAASQATADQ